MTILTDITVPEGAGQPLDEPPLKVTVPLGERSYDVLIGHGLMGVAGALIASVAKPGRALIVTDTQVGPRYLARLRRVMEAAGFLCHHVAVAEGEGSKSPQTLFQVVDAILDAQLERNDVVIALGGGVVGDLAGFAAAVSRRGMPFVQVPTTLLAQVDSAVGGKTGINTRHGKNLVGAFHQPALVLCDLDALATLPDRHVRAGYAEIIKIALIGDVPFFARLSALGADAPRKDVARSIATAVEAKARIVAEDEREADKRALLNLGHTFAHAIEQCAGYDGRIVHGEAVGLGLCLAFRFSVALGLCAQTDAERVTHHLEAVGLPTTFQALPLRLTIKGLVSAMEQDKKVSNAIIRFVLVRGIGEAFVSNGVDPEALHAFLEGEGLAP